MYATQSKHIPHTKTLEIEDYEAKISAWYHVINLFIIMVPISEDLCWTILRMAPFIPTDDIVAFTGVSREKIFGILALYRTTGDVVKRREYQTVGRRRLLTINDVAVGSIFICIHCDTHTLQFLQGQIDRSCDTYLDELREELEEKCGVSVTLPTVWRALRRSGYTMKKVHIHKTWRPPTNPSASQLTRQAMERNDHKRAAYLYKIGLLYRPEQLVFVDESSCDRRTTYRKKAWAIRGQRAIRKAFFVRGQR